VKQSGFEQSGFVPSIAGELFYQQQRGAGVSHSSAPLVCIHGGPGFTSYCLEPLFELSNDLAVVCYDQAGCGRSRTRCAERLDFSVAGFVAELEALREHLSVPKMHLLGHSFGGLIAGEYALQYPERVESIVFAGVSIDIPRWMEDAERLIGQMPMMPRMILREGLRSGALNSPAFIDAYRLYAKRHIYGCDDPPASIRRSEEESDFKTYQIVWGQTECVVTGVVKDYSMSTRLPLIASRSLFVCGRFDEATPEAHQYFASLVPDSRCHIFEKSAHHPQLTEREEFVRIIRQFVCRAGECAVS
jgi:proline iminopeptidase